jgi:hypothetical protein
MSMHLRSCGKTGSRSISCTQPWNGTSSSRVTWSTLCPGCAQASSPITSLPFSPPYFPSFFRAFSARFLFRCFTSPPISKKQNTYSAIKFSLSLSLKQHQYPTNTITSPGRPATSFLIEIQRSIYKVQAARCPSFRSRFPLRLTHKQQYTPRAVLPSFRSRFPRRITHKQQYHAASCPSFLPLSFSLTPYS